MSNFNGRRPFDLEAGSSISGEVEDEDLSSSNPFDIARTKNASLKRLKRWRQAALVLNASRRFRYTLDLKKEEEKKEAIRKIRAHAQAILAAYRFKLAGDRLIGGSTTPSIPNGVYEVGQEQLAVLVKDRNLSALKQLGGVIGISKSLQTNLEKGVNGDDEDLVKRRKEYGSNTYPQKKGRSFWRFLWEAWQDLTLIILIIAAVASLGLGIKSEGIKEGWYDGGSICLAVIIVIVVTVARGCPEQFTTKLWSILQFYLGIFYLLDMVMSMRKNGIELF